MLNGKLLCGCADIHACVVRLYIICGNINFFLYDVFFDGDGCLALHLQAGSTSGACTA